MLQTSALQLAPAALDNAMREQARAQNNWLLQQLRRPLFTLLFILFPTVIPI